MSLQESRLLDSIECPSDLRALGREKLDQLAREIREALVRTVTVNGGHLASNLGVVELTLALHYVFDSPRDRLVWDVGHQAYVHKLVTGRERSFSSIRTLGGISGFLSRDESPHDAFGAGHAATSISAALGLAVGRDLQAKTLLDSAALGLAVARDLPMPPADSAPANDLPSSPAHVVAIIGDGAMSSGLAFEGLNNAGHLASRLIVVLNDNEMSIAPNVGALASYLARVRTNRRYHRAKAGLEWTLRHVPSGNFVLAGLKRLRQALRTLFVPTAIWEELGFTYVGPLDGHNLPQLIDVFSRVRDLEKPVLVHVITKKGKGYPPAERDAVGLHGVSPQDNSTPKPAAPPSLNGSSKPAQPKPPTYTKVFGDTLLELAREDRRIVAITAAMPDGTGLSTFARVFPDRFFDVGIAEGHAVTFAAGLAAAGLRPVVAIYSTFLQRAFDSIVHDVCIQNLPVVFALDRAGLVGEDGRTHHGAFDLAYLRAIPNLTVMAPRDEAELQRMLKTALSLDGPTAIRYPRGTGLGVPLARLPREIQPIEVGRAELLRAGGDLGLIALGSMVEPSLQAAEELARLGIAASVVDARFVKPLDEQAILAVARSAGRLVTVEEAARIGGLGSAVAELLADRGLSEAVQVLRLGLPDQFVDHGTQAALRSQVGLDAGGIVRASLAAYPSLLEAVARPA